MHFSSLPVVLDGPSALCRSLHCTGFHAKLLFVYTVTGAEEKRENPPKPCTRGQHYRDAFAFSKCVHLLCRNPNFELMKHWASSAIKKFLLGAMSSAFFLQQKKSHFYEKFRCQLGRIFFHTKNFDGRNFFRTWGHNLKKIKIKLPSSYENSFKSISESSENAVRCFKVISSP